MLYAKAATNEPTKKTTFATRRIGFRPKMSENFAQRGVELAAPKRYADPIQVYPDEEWNCSAIVGSAVVMMVFGGLVFCG